MADKTIFARAKPSTIRVSEEYRYWTEISRNPRTEPLDTPTGLLQVIVPYDGYESFSPTAVADVQRQRPTLAAGGTLLARIGHLGFDSYAHTNLDERLGLSLHNGTVPLDIPVEGDGLTWPGGVRDDRHACQITYDYVPDWPEALPIKVEASIFDEEILGDEPSSPAGERQREGGQRWKEVAQQAGFMRSLIFAFDLALVLPSRVGRQDDPVPPLLTSMALRWPVATSPRLVELRLRSIGDSGEPWPIAFNPEAGVIEWGNIKLDPPSKKEEGTDLVTYRAPRMFLQVLRPGELYQEEKLTGYVRVELGRLFSALRMAYYDANGRQTEARIEPSSVLATDYTLYLHDRFGGKTFSPYQQLQFEGVILDEMRVEDIKTLLRDQGFRSEAVDLSTGAGRGEKRYLIQGIRQEGPEELRLWMLVEGSLARTTRTREIAGGETYQSDIETGNTTIYMRGQMRGDPERLTRAMNNVTELLKERFFHVSTHD